MAAVQIRNPETGQTKTTHSDAVDGYLDRGWQLADSASPPLPPTKLVDVEWDDIDEEEDDE